MGANVYQQLKSTWLHPRYLASLYLRRLLEAAAAHASGVLVDVGCGHRPYERLFRGRYTRYVGIDVPVEKSRAALDIVGDAQSLPLRGGCADTVLATEVIEHLPDAMAFLGEIHRVLRPGGVLILSAPFMEPIHEEPRDFVRFTPYGLRSLLERSGFDVRELSARGGWWSVVVGSFVSQTIYEWGNPLDATGARRRTPWGALLIPACTVAQLSAYGLDRLMPSRRYSLGYLVIAAKPSAARAGAGTITASGAPR